MSFFKKNPILTLGLLALVLVGLPAAIFLTQKPTENRSKASPTVTLSFAPSSTQSSPLNVKAGNTITLDVMLDPGTSIVSYLKSEINYDATKLQAGSGALQLDLNAFPTVLLQPVYSSGKIQFVVSAGADPTKAIQRPTKIGTLTLSALPSSSTSSVPTQVTFSSITQALSIDPSSTPKENVIGSTVPANLLISQNGVTLSPTTLPAACANNPSDTMLVIDKSGSMSVASDVNKITQAKVAAKNYVDIISQNTSNTIGLVSYENTATVNSPLTTNYSSVKTQIDSLTAIGSTCTECAILAANAEIAKSTTSNKKVVILLTDGLANYIQGGNQQVDTALAEQRALAAAVAGHTAKGTVFYTIGLGQSINSNFLQQIANSTGGKYFPSPTADQLNTIYQQISQIAGKGSVNGKVYNDANGNGTFDAGESILSGWTLQLLDSSHPGSIQSFTSDANGFNITGLCNGTYNLKEVLQNGWRPTQPTDPNGYTIVINNGNAITDKNFGNKQAGGTCSDGIDNNNNNLIDIQDPSCHTDGNPDNPSTYDPDRPEDGNTCADKIDNNGNNLIDRADPICHTDGNPNNPGSYDPHRPENGGNGTSIDLTVFLHGIGNSGDNATNLNSLSNKNPLHPNRQALAMIFNTKNELISSASGQINYASASGNYKGRVQTSIAIAPGSYNVKVFTGEHLVRLVPGIQTITTGNNTLQPISMVAGDINNDNKLNILDYNTLLDCYNDTLPAPSCTEPNKKVITDLNDDGNVNGPDYNLFVRELSTQPGE